MPESPTQATPHIAGEANTPISATQQVVESLLQLLRTGAYRVGVRLPSERALAEASGVGRSAVREAVRELIAHGLLEIQRGRGTFVRSLRPDLLVSLTTFSDEPDTRRELLEARLIIEPEAASLAAQRATQEDLTRLHMDVQRLDEAIAVGYRPPEDLGFHLDVVRATNNRSLFRLTSAIVSFYQLDSHLPTQRDLDEHGEVLDAIRRRDPDSARKAMRNHLAAELAILESEPGQRPI